MAVTQISKIQLRRGLQQDLDVNSLDSGEMGFATDTGRLFVGTDPTQNGPWSTRATLPYDSIEILTENSLDTFARLFDRMNRGLGPTGLSENLASRRPFIEANLAANSTAWTDLLVFTYDNNGNLENPLTHMAILSNTRSVSAVIPYCVFNGNNVIQSGALSAIHDGNTAIDEAVLTDEHVSNQQIASTGAPFLVDEIYNTGLIFRVVRVGTNPSYSFRLQYQNASSSALRIQFRVMIAAKS